MSRIAVLNAQKLNFDRRLSFDGLKLEGKATVQVYDDTEQSQLIERLDGVVVAITKEMPMRAEAIASLPATVKLIVEAGTGYNNIDRDACRAKGITVCNVPAYSTDAVAQLVVAYVMSLACSLTQQQRKVQQGDRIGWQSLGKLPHFELNGKVIGLIGGSGSIGQRVAEIALALGMTVLVSSRKPSEGSGSGPVQVVDMATLLSQSDFVSIHCPLTESTRGLIGKDQLKLMKPSAYIINTARGPIINEAELVAALKNGTLAGAALDVHEVEPLPSSSELWEMHNVILTNHIGWQRLETRQRLISAVQGNIEAFLSGSPINTV